MGIVCYAHENDQKSKLDARAKQGAFVGCDRGSSAYPVYHNDTRNVKTYRCVTFVEKSMCTVNVRQAHVDDDDVSHKEVNDDVDNKGQMLGRILSESVCHRKL